MKYLILLLFSLSVFASDRSNSPKKWEYDIEPPEPIEDSFYYDSIHKRNPEIKPSDRYDKDQRESLMDSYKDKNDRY